MSPQASIKVTFPDGSSATYPKGTPLAKIIEARGDLPPSTIAAKINGSSSDLNTPLSEDTELTFISCDSTEGQDILRHSTSHIMAQAVQELYPGVKVSIGPSIENGFYYDFDYERPFTPEDLEKIEIRMGEIVAQDLPIERKELSRQEALKFYREKGEPYKVELLEEMDDEKISIYSQGNFTDLCRGPHIPSTGKAKSFKLTSVAGAYWRGNEKNKMLQRIYGIAFADQKKLDHYLNRLEEAKKRDHRKLGKELELFSINAEVGAGLIIYHPKGAFLRILLEDFEVREHLKRG